MNTSIQEVVDTEPLKLNMEQLVDKSDLHRKIFYYLLRIFMLRHWYIRKELRHWGRRRSDKHMHILDAGSGYGQNTFFLANECPKWNILAVDVKSNQISGCNHFFQHAGKQNVTFRWRDLTELHMEDSFDLILSVETLTYIEEDEKVMHNFYDALKHDGVLLLWFPICSQSKKVHDANAQPDAPHRVRNGYNIEKLGNKLRQIGFSKIQSYEVYGRYGLLSRKLYAIVPTRMLHYSKATALILPFYYLITLPVCLLLNLIDYNIRVKQGAYAIVKAWK